MIASIADIVALTSNINDMPWTNADWTPASRSGLPIALAAVQSAFVHGMSLMLLVGAAMSAALAIVAIVVMRRPPTARHRGRPRQPVVGDERQSTYAGG